MCIYIFLHICLHACVMYFHYPCFYFIFFFFKALLIICERSSFHAMWTNFLGSFIMLRPEVSRKHNLYICQMIKIFFLVRKNYRQWKKHHVSPVHHYTVYTCAWLQCFFFCRIWIKKKSFPDFSCSNTSILLSTGKLSLRSYK